MDGQMERTQIDLQRRRQDQVATWVARSLDDFYRNPANVAAYEKWMAQREAQHDGHLHE